MNGVRCLVFDIDDTLYLERSYVRSGFRAVSAWVEDRLAVAGFFSEAWSLFEAGSRGTVFDRALVALGLDPRPRLVAKMVSVYRRHEPDIELLADAASCLEALGSGFHLAAVTDGPLASQLRKARALGLPSRLRPIVFTAALGEAFGKPSPEAFRLVEERAGAAAHACAYVADNPAKDFRGPAALGWRTIRVRRPESLHLDVESGPDVDVEIEHLGALEAAL